MKDTKSGSAQYKKEIHIFVTSWGWAVPSSGQAWLTKPSLLGRFENSPDHPMIYRHVDYVEIHKNKHFPICSFINKCIDLC